MAFVANRVSSFIYLCAFDNLSINERVVVNLALRREISQSTSSASEYNHAWRGHRAWSYIDELYVYCRGESFKVDLWKFAVTDSTGERVYGIDKKDFQLKPGGSPGQREFMFSVKFSDNEFKMLFLARDRSFRVIESTYDPNEITGVLFTQVPTTLPKLKFITQI